MEVIQVEEKLIKGISVRTNNADEMNAEKAKIGKLWEQFNRTVPVDYQSGEPLFGIYSDYQSDATGDFTVTAGYLPNASDSASADLDQVTIPKGNYLVFSGEGAMPQVVIEAWQEVWEYFSQADSPHRRAYTVDFEFYRSDKEVEIYIAIV